MRVIIVNKFAYGTGGADHQCLATAAALRQRGHEVVFLATASPWNLVEDGVFVRARVDHATRDAIPVTHRVQIAAAAFWNRDAARAMRSLAERFRPDVVHAHKLYPQLSVAPIATASHLGIPVVQTLHDYELMSASALDAGGSWLDHDETRLDYKVLNTLTFPLRRTLHVRCVAFWITVSRYVADAYSRSGIHARVLPNFATPEFTAEFDQPSFERRHGAVFIGRLVPEKGVRDVLALARLLPELPIKIVGRGPLSEEVAAHADQLPNVTYVGELEHTEVPSLIQGARVALVPSRWDEPGSLAALESMACGTPVAAYPRGGLAEYVRGSGGGVVTEIERPEALAEASLRLHRDRDLWQDCSRRGLEAMADMHSRDHHVDRLETIYEEARR